MPNFKFSCEGLPANGHFFLVSHGEEAAIVEENQEVKFDVLRRRSPVFARVCERDKDGIWHDLGCSHFLLTDFSEQRSVKQPVIFKPTFDLVRGLEVTCTSSELIRGSAEKAERLQRYR